MKNIFCWLVAMVYSMLAFSQNTLKISVKDADNHNPLAGALILSGEGISKTDILGYAELRNIPAGKHLFKFQLKGYEDRADTLVFPLAETDTLLVLLKPEGEVMEEVIVRSTRSSRTIQNIPTRIEFIAGEELDEKSNMKPGDIRMVLSESTGIQTQQTSATSANSAIRIQGLDGRYTQLLKDGFPLYSGAASGLGLLQTPPLDLKQIEVVKGSASTLYGGGAIAGLVNLISKEPGDEPELNFQLNATSAKGMDINGFYAKRLGKAGLTLFAARNSNKAYDPAGIDLTAIPEFERYTFNPKLFFYFNDKTKLSFGLNSSTENRIGGDLHFIEGEDESSHTYFEKNKSARVSSQFSLQHSFNDKSSLVFKNSLSYFDRELSIPGYLFDGQQYASFSELTYNFNLPSTEWIAGMNIWTDKFLEENALQGLNRSYSQNTVGAFVQNNRHISHKVELETGLRADYVNDYGWAVLPRISFLFKAGKKINSRIGGGFGYKTPGIFTEDSERIQFRNVQPVSPTLNKLERSYGLNADINFRTPIFNTASFNINQLFFYTYLNNPLTLNALPNGTYGLVNSAGHIDTRGMETNVKLAYHDFKLFLGYTFTDTKLHENDRFAVAMLTPKHRLNNVLMYELEDKWKIGAEAYYFSKQKLNDGSYGKSYWTAGFMAEKLWEHFSIYINFENFTDTRQTRFGNIYTGSLTKPVFKDIYAPLDGFVVNGGLKLKW